MLTASTRCCGPCGKGIQNGSTRRLSTRNLYHHEAGLGTGPRAATHLQIGFRSTEQLALCDSLALVFHMSHALLHIWPYFILIFVWDILLISICVGDWPCVIPTQPLPCRSAFTALGANEESSVAVFPELVLQYLFWLILFSAASRRKEIVDTMCHILRH